MPSLTARHPICFPSLAAAVSSHATPPNSALPFPSGHMQKESFLSRSKKLSAKKLSAKKTPVRKSNLHPTAASRRGRAKTGRASADLATAGRPALNGSRSEPHVDAEEIDVHEDEHDELPAEVPAEFTEPFGEEVEADATGMDDHIDDPVRIYLMQMGENPLLSRAEEVAAAKEIERTRTRFRHSLLASDYVLHGAAGLLRKVREGKLRLDRTIEVSVTNLAEKKNMLLRLEPNLKTLTQLLRQNRKDFAVAISRSMPSDARHAAWRRLVRRRNKAIRLIEELNLRTNRLQPLLNKMTEIRDRAICLRNQLSQKDGGGTRLARSAPRRIAAVDSDHAGKPFDAGPPHEADRLLASQIRSGEASALGRQLAAGRLDRQEIPQPRAELSRSHSGGKHRPDAGRR